MHEGRFFVQANIIGLLLFVGGLFSKTAYVATIISGLDLISSFNYDYQYKTALDSAIEKETGIIIVETKMTSDCPRVHPSNTVYVFEWEDCLMDYMSNYCGMQEDIL